LNANFDLETYDTEDELIVPIASRNTSHISMISFVYKNTAILYCLDKYDFDTEFARKKLINHCGRDYNIEVVKSKNEREMVLKFILEL